MKSQWNDQEAAEFKTPLQTRVYTSRLLGRETSLVLHGGGNTSVKDQVVNIFKETQDVLYVKGSGWDLATIEEAGFAPVKMDVLLKLASLEKLSDTDMVREQRSAMLNPNAPTPSVEAILHAIIPFKYVDHTHADAVVAITNTPKGEELIKNLYGDRVLYVPYVMPGFILARKIYELTRDVNWEKLEGMILLNHGVFTFSNSAKESYERMIGLVNEAEEFLKSHQAFDLTKINSTNKDSATQAATLSRIRQKVSQIFGKPVITSFNQSHEAVAASNLDRELFTRGTLTPDHVIHTKPKPVYISDTSQIETQLANFAQDYKNYFSRNNKENLTILDTAPRWAVWAGQGIISFAPTAKTAAVIMDIVEHTAAAIQWSEKLGGWKPLEESKLFEVEYWELEQAKIKKKGDAPLLQGKIALVTGAASGIGLATVKTLLSQGASVVALDINPKVTELSSSPAYLGLVCDLSSADDIKNKIQLAALKFGGLDILVSNAGLFPEGRLIQDLPDDDWDKSLNLNLTSHKNLLKASLPFLKLGFDSQVIFVASKNVPAPGPGASAYSVAKAGLTQLARVAALELAKENIRVNVIHPDAVFDTGIWTKEILENRAKHYGLTVDEYKKKNLLKAEITSQDVANLIASLLGPGFAKTTGAQIPIDGGNDRVI